MEVKYHPYSHKPKHNKGLEDERLIGKLVFVHILKPFWNLIALSHWLWRYFCLILHVYSLQTAWCWHWLLCCLQFKNWPGTLIVFGIFFQGLLCFLLCICEVESFIFGLAHALCLFTSVKFLLWCSSVGAVILKGHWFVQK